MIFCYGILFGIEWHESLINSVKPLINNQNPMRVMMQKDDQNIYADFRFWLVVIFTLMLLSFLIMSYPG
ncbi:MAG: hypothetical protein ACO3M5_09095 [Saprospiraceae bacterium]|jgi:hypothetical protein